MTGPITPNDEGWEFDDEPDDDEDEAWADCGRWRNGKLSDQCLKAGSEECDWECPIGC